MKPDQPFNVSALEDIHELLQAGLKLHQSGDLIEAEKVYQKVLSIDANNIDANQLLGAIAIQRKNYDLAINLFQTVLMAKPDFAEVHNNLGYALKESGQLDAAVFSLEAAIAIKPDYVEAHNNLGLVFRTMGKLENAIYCFKNAIAINANYIVAQNNLAYTYNKLGNRFKETGKLEKAIEQYQKSIAVKADFAEGYNNLACTLKECGQLDEAITGFRKAILLKPDYAAAFSNLGCTLVMKGQLDEAVSNHRQAISIDPDYAEAYNNLGCVLRDTGQLNESEDAFRHALQLNPDYPGAQFNWSTVLLLKGEFATGWKKYSYRFKTEKFANTYPQLAIPQWKGESLHGKTIFVWCEQGLGDTIHFARYLKKIKESNAYTLLVQTPANLRRLLSSMPYIERFIEPGEVIAADYHIPLMSLPEIYKTTPDTIPHNIPYIKAETELVEQWHKQLKADNNYKIGLAWAGKPTHSNDHFRSARLHDFLRLLSIPGTSYYSLQKGAKTEHLNEFLNEMAEGSNFVDLTEQLEDLADTAALMANLDLVISVDTCMAHLAGALGRPVWTLLPANPEWRWLLDREDSPWYPTMQLYRQNQLGDWTSVIEKIDVNLRAMLK